MVIYGNWDLNVRISHSIKQENIAKLQKGIRKADIIIKNPERNSLVFITDIKQDGYPVLVSFSQNADFDGDRVHKATSIHLQIDVNSMLEALPETATVYLKNKKELNNAVGVTNNLRSLAANVEFIDEIIPQNSEKSSGNTKFSLSNPVEETKNLVALHNLNANKLNKVIDLGGFPMPSIAVTKTDIPHTDFGDITLVMNKSTIDPKANRKNTVYSADAWTPTVPRTEYKPNDNRLREISNKIYELVGDRNIVNKFTKTLNKWCKANC